jgi:hypothetical protein
MFYLWLIGLFIPGLFVLRDLSGTSTALVGLLTAFGMAVLSWFAIYCMYILARNSAMMKLRILLNAL